MASDESVSEETLNNEEILRGDDLLDEEEMLENDDMLLDDKMGDYEKPFSPPKIGGIGPAIDFEALNTRRITASFASRILLEADGAEA